MGIYATKNKSPRSEFQIPLLRSYTKKQQQAKQQEELRAEYNISRQNLLIVEKKNAIAQILRTMFHALFTVTRVIINVLLIALATIGLAGIIYPNTRAELMKTGYAILHEVLGYFNLLSS
ncbi:MAG: hypothetical protein FWG21_00420 [Oscillospiraceae bacterium]|nr:hypothetical protein [Oscillospiraceae bacterium]